MCEHPIMNNGRLIQQEHKRAEAYESELKLDKDQDSGLVYLTPDNAAKIEARIHLNPRYKKTVDDSNEKSTKFIIRQLKEGKLLYNKDNIEEIIKRINSENSTRMSKDEMGEIAGRIIKSASTKDILMKMLKEKDYSLIDEIAKPINTTTKDKKKERNRSNFSFATKFCHYMCFYLFEGEDWQDNYSIYDNIVINVLPDYINNRKSQDILLPFNKDKDIPPSKYYKKYQDLIGDILKENGNRISRNAFDHIMWYYTKTRKSVESADSNSNQRNE